MVTIPCVDNMQDTRPLFCDQIELFICLYNIKMIIH